MNSRRGVIIVLFSIALAFALVGSLALADEFDQAMKITFGQPVAVPGQVLPAGTYWFIRPTGQGASQDVLQIWDGDRKNVIATLTTGSEQIVKPSGHVILTLADRSPKPLSLLTLVYPGRTDGHSFEIVYPSRERRQLSEFPKITMKVGEKGEIEKVDTTAGNSGM